MVSGHDKVVGHTGKYSLIRPGYKMAVNGIKKTIAIRLNRVLPFSQQWTASSTMSDCISGNAEVALPASALGVQALKCRAKSLVGWTTT